MSYVQPVKIAVIGMGKLGSSFAYASLLKGLASELVLIDKYAAKAELEALDLQEAALFAHPVQVRAGTMLDVAGAAITVICAGERPEPGQSTSDLVLHNAALIKEMIPVIAERNPQGIILLGTSPIDVLTYGAWKISGLQRRQIIGVGTMVETARLRSLLGQQFRIDPGSVQAYVLGENGESEIPVWSAATIAGMPLLEACFTYGCDRSALGILFKRNSQTSTVNTTAGGFSHHAVASALVNIAEAILRDEKRVLPVCTVLLGEYGMSRVAMSVPAVLGREGVDRILRSELSDEEVAELLFAGRKIEREILRADFAIASSVVPIRQATGTR